MFGDMILVILTGVLCSYLFLSIYWHVLCLVACYLLLGGALCVWWPVPCYLEGRSMFGDLFLAICRDVLCLHCDVVNFVGH